MVHTARIDASALGQLIVALIKRGYEVIAPKVQDGAISYAPIAGIEDLPAGWTSKQEAGSYRLERRRDNMLFGYANGPKSLKDFLYPAEIKLLDMEQPFRILPNAEPAPRRAFLGVRACELAAAGIQDRVLPGDPLYQARRGNCLFIAVHCTEPAATCFCTSWNTGPRARSGYDLALTELEDEFFVEVGSQTGAELLSAIPHTEAPEELEARSRGATADAAQRMHRRLDPHGLRERLRDNFDHPHWDEVAARCLACGNCTLVCPTCFCTTIDDASDLTGAHAGRWRRWDSCFTLDFSHLHGGSVRTSVKSRYRQWLSHKLSYWFDQFGTSGCVGCGRCITWCPVGIDLTQEAAAFPAPERSVTP